MLTARHQDSVIRRFFGDDSTLTLLGDVNEAKVLDAGCGDGHHMSLLTHRGARVCGIDIAADAVQSAREQPGLENAHIVMADLREGLPFCDGHFDAVLASLVLHYLRDWQHPLAEMKRVLSIGGVLAVAVQHPFADYLESKSREYWACERWAPAGFVADDDLEFWRRPLGATIEAFADIGFVIESIAEPRPIRPLPIEYQLGGVPRLLTIRARHAR